MNVYSNKQKWKFILLVFAILIGVSSFFITNKLTHELAQEERKKLELWAMGMKKLSTLNNPESDYTFYLEVIKNNETVPVILTNKKGEIISSRNLDPQRENDSLYLQKQLKKMKAENEPIEVELLDDNKNYIYYRDSTLLTKLTYFPLIQFGVLLVFLFVGYLAFSSSRRAEQNQVWVGMSKETAHQLGTPTSSLLANVELLKLKNLQPEIVAEFDKDINRLEKITDRFSKIGSSPKLERKDILPILNNAVEYIRARSSRKIKFDLQFDPKREILVPFNDSLFEWVIENLCKNAIDAMGGEGKITIRLDDRVQYLFIDIHDEGNGIPKSKYKTIFQPGYTTKTRGWGLGLSLSKRIIENYHGGKIFVNQSSAANGTTMRIVLKR